MERGMKESGTKDGRNVELRNSGAEGRKKCGTQGIRSGETEEMWNSGTQERRDGRNVELRRSGTERRKK
jgi:hypothetical protein